MHTKLIQPKIHGQKVFRNRGTVNRLIAYLLHEVREADRGEDTLKEAIFFDQQQDHLGAERVIQALNSYGKGIRKGQERFFSLVISPSAAELRHIGPGDEKLKTYVRCIMDDYARGFRLKDGRQLQGEALLWYAVIHTGRKVEIPERQADDLTGKEEKEQALLISGTKAGLHRHVHIVVSRRDKSGLYSLNPRGRKAHFDLRKWQENNGYRFQQLFGYGGETLHVGFYFSRQDRARQDKRIADSIHLLNDKYMGEEKLEAEQFQRLGAKYNYSRAFFINLGRLNNRYRQGDYFVDPYYFVARGRDIKPEEYAKLDKREEKESRHYSAASVSSGQGFRLQELLAAFRQYQPFDFVRDPLLFEGELRRKRKPLHQKEEGKQEEVEP